MMLLSQQIRDLRDELLPYEDDGRFFAPAAIDAIARLLTAFAAQAVALERVAPHTTAGTLRIAERLERMGVKRGAGAQPPLSARLQDVAEALHGHFKLNESILPDRVIAQLNELSAALWSLEQRAALAIGINPESEPAPLLVDAVPLVDPALRDPKIVDLCAARRERST
ncbi:MAG TPA: hypothetical protein VGL83_13600 [Stellaceae bacterium]|jgi:hypothetical protein